MSQRDRGGSRGVNPDPRRGEPVRPDDRAGEIDRSRARRREFERSRPNRSADDTWDDEAEPLPSPKRAMPPPASRPRRTSEPFAAEDVEATFSPSLGGRTSSSRAPVPAEWPDDPNDPGAWLNHGDALAADTAAWEGVPARGGRSAGTRRGRETARSRVRERTHIASPRPGSRGLRTPSALGGSDLLADSVALTLLAVGLLSLVIMALSLAVRIGSLPPSLVLHVDAFGDPDRWGAPRVLLRLPLLAAMTTILNVVLAWFLSPIERFASRFLLAAALVVQLITWVALLDFI